MLAAAVAAAAVGGVVVAIVVSSGGGSGGATATSPATSASDPAATGTTASTAQVPPPAPTTSATTPRRSATGPVDTTSVRLPPPPGPKSPRARTLIVGVVDDALAQRDRHFAQAQADVSRDAGFDAAVVTATWRRGQRQPDAALLEVLRNVSSAARRARMRLFVVVWHGLGRDTPRNAAERADFAAYAGAVARSLPLQAVIVGNEPNLSTFWRPQFGAGGFDLAARAYGDLLARTYDAVKAAKPSVRVLGGALSPRGGDRPGGALPPGAAAPPGAPGPTHPPTAFIRALGAASPRSGRKRPLMDGFAIH